MWVVVSVSWAQADSLYQAVGDNDDELVQRLEETANRLLAVEKAVFDLISESEALGKAVEEAKENLELYVIFRAPKGYYKELVTIQDPWERNEGPEGPCR